MHMPSSVICSSLPPRPHGHTPTATPSLAARRLARSPLGLGLMLCAWLATLLLAPGTACGQSLDDSIQDLIERYKIDGAVVGYRVEDVRTGMVLASKQAELPMLPASNMKLLTTGSALVVLGPDFSFRTTIHREGGDVTIVGDGDPSLGDPEVLSLSDPPLTIDALFDKLAAATVKAQTGPITSVKVDARIFDRELVHPSWEQGDLAKHYAAQVSGLNIHTNNLAIFTAPSESGGQPKISIQPKASWVVVSNKARSDTTGTNTAWIARTPGENRFTLHGTVVRRESWPIKSPLDTPSLFCGRLLASALEHQLHDGRDLVSEVQLLTELDPLPQGDVVAVVSTPLAEVLLRCNRDSQNLYAESLLKRLGQQVTGRPGSWADGAAVERMLLTERLGPEHAARVVIADGSGLSRDNLVAPITMTAWLRSFYNDPKLREPLFSSLATPGEGTFTRRFRNLTLRNRVRGKSGSLTGVRTLSGVITHPVTGRTLAFAIFVSQGDKGVVAVNARDFADRTVGVLDKWLTAEESVEALGG